MKIVLFQNLTLILFLCNRRKIQYYQIHLFGINRVQNLKKKNVNKV